MKKKYKILECIRQGSIGGGETHMLDLVKHLDHEKYTPVVLSFTDGPMIDELKKMKIKTYVIPTLKAFNFFTWTRIKNLILSEQIDLVHAHGSRACSNLIHVVRKLKIPLVYTIHGWSFHPGQRILINRMRIQAEKYLTANTSLNICVSKSNQKDGIDKLKLKNSVVIYNGTPLSNYQPSDLKCNVRNELSIDNNIVLIGFIGRITTQKSPILLVNAIEKLVKRFSNVRLLMVGEGDLKAKTIETVKASGISDYVIFHNFRNDVPELLSAIDIYCLPSLWEGFSIGLLEACAMSKAIVASEVDGTKELITDGVNGLFVKPGDLDDLVAHLSEMIENTELRTRLGNQAYLTVKEHFTIPKMVQAVEAQYFRIITQ